MRTGFVERHGKLTELDRSFDLKFWQDQPAQARFDAAWELIVHAHKVKGGDVRQLRLQRSVETFQRQPGVDILMGIPGAVFAEVWPRRVEVDFDGLVVPFIAPQDLIAAKRAAGRPQDLLDVASLTRPEDKPTKRRKVK